MQIKYRIEKTDFQKWMGEVNAVLEMMFTNISPELRQQLNYGIVISPLYNSERLKIESIFDRRYTIYTTAENPYTVGSSMIGFAFEIYAEQLNKE